MGWIFGTGLYAYGSELFFSDQLGVLMARSDSVGELPALLSSGL